MDAIDAELEPWWRPISELIAGDESGEPRGGVFDAHTHIGENDPDEQAQTLAELLAALAPLHARAAVFPMHEPDGYTAANDEVIAAAAANPETLVAYCRVDPREPQELISGLVEALARPRGVVPPGLEMFALPAFRARVRVIVDQLVGS